MKELPWYDTKAQQARSALPLAVPCHAMPPAVLVMMRPAPGLSKAQHDPQDGIVRT
jgi:hypothetical protein